jgi:hypothetical protein
MRDHAVSRRQAQRIVAAGVRAMVADVAEGEELSLASAGVIHQTLATLQRAAQVALYGERPQPAAAVGAARAIIALTELASRLDEVSACDAITRREREAMIRDHEAWEAAPLQTHNHT